MTDDISKLFGAVKREVRKVKHEGKPALMVVMTRSFDTTIEDLWDALTSAERLPRWFLPISGELKLGGRYQLKGNAGGTITRCEPPRELSVTWEFGGGVSWVNVSLSEQGAATRLELQHIAHPDPHWDKFGPGAVGVGWDLGLLGLARHIADPAAAKPPEADPAWIASDEAKRFMTQSSDDWALAAVGAGEDEAVARASAERTRAFYCGEGG
jgi:uncharacterized protein YndB with AHSA1/START domain